MAGLGGEGGHSYPGGLFEANAPPPPMPSKAGPSPGGAGHPLDVLGALVVDEDDDGVDVHMVQSLDGVRGNVQEAVPVLQRGEVNTRAGAELGLRNPASVCHGGAPLLT